jgi:hypothetical protein
MDQEKFNQICSEYAQIKDKSEWSLIVKIISDNVQGCLTDRQKFILQASERGADSTAIYHYSANGQQFSWTGTFASNPTALELFVLS